MNVAAALLGLVAAFLVAAATYLAIVGVHPEDPHRAWTIFKAGAWFALLTCAAIAWGEWFPWLQTLYQPIVPR